MRQANSFFAALRTSYLKQGQLGRILLPAAFLLVFCCLCSIFLSLLRLRTISSPQPSPVVATPEGTLLTPTPLFDFDFPTFTPFPTATFFVPTPFPSLTPLPTGSPTPTQVPSTSTPLPTSTPPATATVTPTPTNASPVLIVNVDKVAEYAEIQNRTQAPINLRDWRLVSANGGETCELRGTLEPGEVLRIWARRGDPGFDCRLGREIWNDTETDPAVLYNARGEEISRYP